MSFVRNTSESSCSQPISKKVMSRNAQYKYTSYLSRSGSPGYPDSPDFTRRRIKC